MVFLIYSSDSSTDSLNFDSSLIAFTIFFYLLLYIYSLPKILKKNFMAPFHEWGSTASRLEPLQGGSFIFTTKFPEIPGTHFINLGRIGG